MEYAARMIEHHKIGMLPVGDKENVRSDYRDRDIAVRITAEAKDATHTPVREVMTPNGAYCFADQDIEDACFMMEEKHVRRLLVFDRMHDLVGILSLDDVAMRGRKEKLAGYALSKSRGLA